jgi:hypothetical protein
MQGIPKRNAQQTNRTIRRPVRNWLEAAELSNATGGSYLGYTGRIANVVARGAHDPQWKWRSSCGGHAQQLPFDTPSQAQNSSAK